MVLKSFRTRLVGTVGVNGTHAIEDGGTTGIALGLWFTFQPAAVLLLCVLTGIPKGGGPLAILRSVVEIVRADDAREQESLFALSMLGGALLGAGVGTVLTLAAAFAGVPVPTVGELLSALA